MNNYYGGGRAKRPGAGLAPGGWKYEPQDGYFRSKTEHCGGGEPRRYWW